jgi:DUF2911 family protein
VRNLFLAAALTFSLIAVDGALAQRAASPRGEASTQIGPDFGSWIVVDYGRPILRGRHEFFGLGTGDDIRSGAPVWRLGADMSTRFMTETDLMIGEQVLPAGEYSMFADMGEEEWTLIFSNHKAKSDFNSDEEGLWGAYGYSEEKDVLRTPLHIEPLNASIDQFTISFMSGTESGGQMALIWDDTMALVAFSIPSVAD